MAVETNQVKYLGRFQPPWNRALASWNQLEPKADAVPVRFQKIHWRFQAVPERFQRIVS